MNELHWPISSREKGICIGKGIPQNIYLWVPLYISTALSIESYFAQNYMMDGMVEWKANTEAL